MDSTTFFIAVVAAVIGYAAALYWKGAFDAKKIKDAELVAVRSRNIERAKDFARKHGAEAFTDYGQIGIKVWIYSSDKEKERFKKQPLEIEEKGV